MIFKTSTAIWLLSALKPLIYAFILAFLLDSVVRFFERKLKIRRNQGIFLACLLLLGIVVTLFYIIVPKLVENINAISSFFLDGNIDITVILSGLKNKINNEYINYATDSVLAASESLKAQFNDILRNTALSLMNAMTNLGSKMITLITSFIINIYMLAEKDKLINWCKSFLYAYLCESRAKRTIYIFKKANTIFKSFLTGKIIDSSIVGLICAILFTIFKVPYAALMGTVIGLFNIIPYFGPIIGSVPVILVSLFINPPKALAALIIILVVQQIDANFMDPRIVGKNVGVSPFWIITAVTLGGNLFGVIGMLFGVPVVVLIKTILEENMEDVDGSIKP